MRKIAVIGINGAGKSTLSNKLGKKSKLQVYHLDKIYGVLSLNRLSRKEGKARQKEIVKKDSWIIDGNWFGTLDIRLEPADTIIYLNFPKPLCLYRIIKRGLLTKGQPFDKQKGVKERITIDLVKKLLSFSKDDVMDKVKKHSHGKIVYILKSQKEVDLFLDSVV